MPFHPIPYVPAVQDGENLAIEKDLSPVFIVGDILGRGSRTLADQINSVCKGRREVYVYEDPRLIAKDDDYILNGNFSLEEQAKILIDQLQPPPFAGYPIIFIPYSYSCSVVEAALKYAKDKQYDPHVLYIDAPSPSLSKAFFTNQPIKSTILLNEILKYAAQRSELRPIDLDEADITDIAKKPFLDRIALISKKILEKQEPFDPHEKPLLLDPLKVHVFNRFLTIIRQNLQTLYEQDHSFEKIDKINLLLTKETKEKYGDNYAGWKPYVNKEVKLISNTDLSDKSHPELLTDLLSNTDLIKKVPPEVLADLLSNTNLVKKAPPEALADLLSTIELIRKAHADHQTDLALTIDRIRRTHPELLADLISNLDQIKKTHPELLANLVANIDLIKKDHTELLADEISCRLLAIIIQDIFSKEIKQEDVFVREFTPYVLGFIKQNPDVDKRSLLEKIFGELNNPGNHASSQAEANPPITNPLNTANNNDRTPSSQNTAKVVSEGTETSNGKLNRCETFYPCQPNQFGIFAAPNGKEKSNAYQQSQMNKKDMESNKNVSPKPGQS